MNSRNDIQSELKLLNSRLPVDATMPVFDLPEAYFENFAVGMLAIVKGAAVAAGEETAALSPLLAGLSKKMPFDLPQGYFSETVAPPATEDILPAWPAEARRMPYAVPDAYFQAFAAQMLEQVAPRGAKVIPMTARKWVRYAAAAIITGALVLGAVHYRSEKPLNPATQSEEWVAKKLDNVSNQELEAFISATEVTGTETAKQVSASRPEVRKLLTDVPSNELDAFLNELPAGTEQMN